MLIRPPCHFVVPCYRRHRNSCIRALVLGASYKDKNRMDALPSISCARLSIRPDPCLGNTHSSFGHKGTRLHSWGRAGAEITCSLFGPQRTRSEVPNMESREFAGGEEVRA